MNSRAASVVSGKPQITTVVTCMTNGERPFIARAIRSVLNQTEATAVQIYVSEANRWIEGELGEMTARVRVRRIPLQPLPGVRNIGIEESETSWVAFLDGDDVWQPEKLRDQLASAERTGRPAVGTRHLMIREDEVPFAYGLARHMPMPSSWLVRRELLVEQPFDPVPAYEDAILWHKYSVRGLTHTLREFHLLYRVREQSLSSGFPPKARKMRVARLSRRPLMRFPLLFVTRVWSMLTPCR